MDRRGAALGCLATIALADKVIFRRRLPWILVGLFDHPAHLATAGLVLLNIGSRPPGWAAGFMAGSLLPDLDHVPLAVSRVHPSMDDPRPVTHCLLAVAPVAVLAEVKRDERLRGAAAGMLAHFARDIGVGTGVPLLWPLTRRSWRAPYALYAAGCALLAARGLQNRVRRASLVDGL